MSCSLSYTWRQERKEGGRQAKKASENTYSRDFCPRLQGLLDCRSSSHRPSSTLPTFFFTGLPSNSICISAAMKASLLFLLVAIRRACGTPSPTLQWGPETTKDCIEWYNNSDGESCEYIRSLFGITPEELHEWNPSVGLDCQPWEYQSYCIVTMEKINNTITTTSSPSSTTTVSTSSIVTPGPSPTSWTDMGCYVEDPALPILEENLSPEGGDAALSIPKCENTCYLKAYVFAGVQGGNQCWCGSYVGGEWASNQTGCSTPCTGDSKAFCGGKGLVNVFKAEQNEASTTTTTTTRASSTTTAAGSTISETHSSEAMRNLAMF